MQVQMQLSLDMSKHGSLASSIICVHRRPGNGLKDPFLHPDVWARPSHLPPSSQPTEYLLAVEANILAEYAAMLKSARPVPFFATEQERSDDSAVITGLLRDQTCGQGIAAVVAGKPEELKQYHRHLFSIRNTLCLLRYCPRQDTLTYTTGAGWKAKAHDAAPAPANTLESGRVVLDFGYIGDFIDEHSACTVLLQQVENGDAPPLLVAVADPRRRQPSAWRSNPVQPEGTGSIAINAEQRSAVAGLVYEVEGIQGPPGTGKSTTIRWIIETRLAPDEVALATCVQNKAMGAIAEKLAATTTTTGHIPFFVEGNPERLDPVAKHWTAAAQAEREVTVAACSAWEATLTQWCDQVGAVICEKERSGLDAPSRLLWHKNRSREPSLTQAAATSTTGRQRAPHARDGWKLLWYRYLARRYRVMYALQRTLSRMCTAVAAQKDVLFKHAFDLVVRSARVVLSTVASTGSLARKEALREATDRITLAILDEAGTTPESKLPMLLLLPKLQKIVAIGDEQQLPPFTHLATQGTCHQYDSFGSCHFGSRCKFSHSGGSVLRGFFQRLNDALPAHRVPTLYEQYRMHPAICSVVSSLFYGGMLRTPQLISDQRVAADPHGLWRVPVIGAETHPQHGGTSYINTDEVRGIVKVFMRARLEAKSVMVITFYKAQFLALCNAFADVGIKQGPNLRICTVDQSQGGEADVVLLSTVRSNGSGRLGFVDSPHRINVAISRARERLVIVGDPLTLRSSHHLRTLWENSRTLDIWA